MHREDLLPEITSSYKRGAGKHRCRKMQLEEMEMTEAGGGEET